MHICIFQTGEPLHIDNFEYRPMRAVSLANILVRNNHKVTLISSAFFHQRKIHRTKKFQQIKLNKNLKIILIPSIGYKKHIGLRRLLDHINLSYNLNLFLRKNKDFKPDKLFLGYPPIESAYVFINWARKNKIPLILDVKDNWPINFIEPFPKFIRPIIKIILFPYFKIAKYIFSNSNCINSISDEFIKWIKTFSYAKNTKYLVTPLVREPLIVNRSNLDKAIYFWEREGLNIFDRKHFSFVGSITKSFDFNFIFKSAYLIGKTHPELKFIICGSGDRFNQIKKESMHIKNMKVIGVIDKYQASLLIKYSIATLAPYQNSENFRNSVPNKIIESLENGTPFITNLEGKLKNMIEKSSNGIFMNGSENSLLSYHKLINDNNYQKELSLNARKSYEDLFDFENSYISLMNNLINIK